MGLSVFFCNKTIDVDTKQGKKMKNIHFLLLDI